MDLQMSFKIIDIALLVFSLFLLTIIYLFLLLAIMAAEEKRKQKEQIKIMKQQVQFLCLLVKLYKSSDFRLNSHV